MSKRLIVIKLGGSVITDKEKSQPTLRTAVIKDLARQIKTIYKSGKIKLILVHGAGSFGHPIAKKHELHKGMITIKQKLGFCLTDHKMLELNSIIMANLLKQAVPAVSIPPRAFIIQSESFLQKFDYSLTDRYLRHNQIPVLFGDVVLDDKWGCSIISGDTIVTYLAQKLRASKVIFLSDVDGIYDADPKKNPQAKLISKINNKNFKEILRGFTANNPDDVTGEMQGKVMAIRSNLKGILVIIANGLKPGNLLSASVQGKVGTKLQFD